jgi:hypothetical protein
MNSRRRNVLGMVDMTAAKNVTAAIAVVTAGAR